MAEGRSNQSIAIKLHISDKTVEACTGRIFTKLGLEPRPDDHRRVRAVLTYLQASSNDGATEGDN
jgi:DNA-binding NarL/FixJ family response regulator